MNLKHGVIIALLASLATGAVFAEANPSIIAKRAAQQIGAASVALQEAKSARDQVAALTQTIKAYEEGLAAMREGLRRASIREQSIRLEFESKRERVSRLLGLLQTMERSPAPLLLLHPAGPIGTARSGMILSEVTPALQVQVDELKTRLEEVALLRALQQSAAQTLEEGLYGVQEARTALSFAISERTDLPRRYADDADQLQLLLNSSETLEGFASGLTQFETVAEIAQPDFEKARGRLPLPVSGTLLRRFDESDAAGIRRPGLLLATRPLSIVTTPWAATIRYRGPLLDYGNVMILEPQEGYLLVLAGLNRVYGEVGEVLPTGTPVGLMGGNAPDAGEFLSISPEGGGTNRTETLYIELRKDESPVDPAAWFALNKE